MQVYLKTLGCRLNEAELESWAERLHVLGHNVVSTPDNADLLVVNTCAVTREAVKKSRQIIRRVRRCNPTAKLVVSGCYASLDKKINSDINGINLVVENKNKDRLVDITLKELHIDATPQVSTKPGESTVFIRGRNRAFIKIQDGCRYRCTFCTVTIARGDERSRIPRDIIKDINVVYDKGVQEVVLTGIHAGGYGSDINNNLYQLLKQILAETSVPRIRLASLEPWDLPEDFFSLFENQRLMPHMHLPLQSGSDAVLRRMARRCKTKSFEKLVANARQQISDLNLTTDVIVGFPGETDEEWQESIDFIKHISFSHIHIFTYSKREGTKAATMPGTINNEIKKQRSSQLHDLTKSMRQQYLATYLGKQRPVLWETRNGHGNWTGYTDNYIRVELKDSVNENLENRIDMVEINGFAPDASHSYVTL